MAYEEKIREIIDCQRCGFPESVRSSYCEVCYDRRITVRMAQYKDEQALKAFCKFTCPDISNERHYCPNSNSGMPCESYKLFERILKGEAK